MADLNQRIADLEEVINGYETEYKTASTEDKRELRALITESRKTLNNLMEEKKMLLAPAPPAGKSSFFLIILCG